MAQVENFIPAKNVASEQDILDVFEEVKGKVASGLSEQDTLDLVARINYFFNRSNFVKLSPTFNSHLIDPGYDGKNNMYKKIVTVPIDKNDYYTYQKGTFVPVCSFSVKDDKKAIENFFLISVDFKNKVVSAIVTTKKIVFGSGQKVIDSFCSGVANFIIPNPSDLMRGKVKDIKENRRKVKHLSLDYSNFFAFNDTIAKSVLPISRVDFDSRHKNTFEDVQNYNSEQENLLNKYFKQFADPPHFHFVYKDYVLNHNMTDSSALAMNISDLTKYLVDLNASNLTDEIVNYNFGMPFVDIKKSCAKLTARDISKFSAGFKNIFDRLSENQKETIKKNIDLTSENMKTRLSKGKSGVSSCNEYLKNAKRILELMTSEQEYSKYDNFNALEILAIQTSAINELYKIANTSASLKSEIGRVCNDFYNTINLCLDSKTMAKNKNMENIYSSYGY